MNIDENTKIIARFHKILSPRGLNIYNPLFQEAHMNAVYLLFYNQDLNSLMKGYRLLNFSGAITAGFESDSILPTLLDGLDDSSKFLGRVGYITTKNGVVLGHSQGGQGMLRTIKHITSLEGKKVVVIGAGNITKGLLFEIEKEGIRCEINLFTRSLEKGSILQERFNFIKSVDIIGKVDYAIGDIFVNLSPIGGKINDVLFSKEVIQKFSYVIDVTFETEETDLMKVAKSLGKNCATGWDMFSYQAQVCIEGILDKHIPYESIKKHVVNGLSAGVI